MSKKAIALLRELEDHFGPAIDSEDDINGGDAVDFIVNFVSEKLRPLLAEADDQTKLRGPFVARCEDEKFQSYGYAFMVGPDERKKPIAKQIAAGRGMKLIGISKMSDFLGDSVYELRTC